MTRPSGPLKAASLTKKDNRGCGAVSARGMWESQPAHCPGEGGGRTSHLDRVGRESLSWMRFTSQPSSLHSLSLAPQRANPLVSIWMPEGVRLRFWLKRTVKKLPGPLQLHQGPFSQTFSLLAGQPFLAGKKWQREKTASQGWVIKVRL